MNKRLIILLTAAVVLAIVYWLAGSRGWSTIGSNNKDFAIKDTAKVTKIFMANKNGFKVTLERLPDGWFVNGKKADLFKVNLLLQTLHDLKVLKPVTDEEHNTVMAILGSKGIKTEVYMGEDLVKTIYVGTETPMQTGTFMLLNDSDEPFVTHIPGFVGYLTPRFIVNEIKLIDRLLVDIPYNQLKLVKLIYPADEGNSFVIENNMLYNLKGTQVQADTTYLKFYLSGFEKLYAEGYHDDFTQTQIDSIKNLTPYCILTLVDMAQKTTELKVYKKPVGKRTKEPVNPETDLPYESDTEKYFAILNNGNSLATIQQYNFGRVFKTVFGFKKPLAKAIH